MDLTDTVIPKSDQLNAEDMLAGPRTVTITEVRAGSAEQPVEIVTAEFGPGRPFKPSKTVRRILIAAWGKEGSVYVGRRMTIYRDPNVKWAGQSIGGIRVSAMSHIDKALTIPLTETRGKRFSWVIQPLTDEPAATKPPEKRADNGLITDTQAKKMRALYAEIGMNERDECLAHASKLIGREITSPTELSKDEADTVITELQVQSEAQSAGAE